MSRERRVVVPLLFLIILLVGSILFALPEGLPTPDFYLPMLALASLLPAGLAGGMASDLVAGERERRSLETFLCAPASPAVLIVGRALSIYVPALALSWASIALVWLALATRSMAPSAGASLAMALAFAPASIAFSLAVGVWVSSRSRTVRGAAQLSALVTVPLVALSQVVPVLTPKSLPASVGWLCASALLAVLGTPVVASLRNRLRPDRLVR